MDKLKKNKKTLQSGTNTYRVSNRNRNAYCSDKNDFLSSS